MNPGPCFYPSRLNRGDDGDGGGGGGLHARCVVVEGYYGEVVDVRDVFVAGFVRGRDRLEGVRSAAPEVQFEIGSQD